MKGALLGATEALRSRKRRVIALVALALVLLVTTGAVLVARGGRSASVHHNPAWLPEPRTRHAAVALADGRVLVIGGSYVRRNNAGYRTSALLYDPAADRWTPAAPPPPAADEAWGRTLAARLGDGRALVVLRGDGKEEDTALLYVPVADRWERIATLGLRYTLTLVSLTGGAALAVSMPTEDSGGAIVVQLYDPVGTTWREAAPPPHHYDNLVVVALADGGALIVGQTYPPPTQRIADRYDAVTNTWRSAAVPPDWVPLDPQAVRLADGRVLFAGGYCCGPSADRDPAAAALYDPVADRWEAAGRMVQARWSDELALTALPDGRALVTGGHLIDRPANQQVGATADVEVYDPATNTWGMGTPLTQARSWHTATPLADGRVLVVGGMGPVRNCAWWEPCWPNGEFPTLASVEWYRPMP